MGWLWEIDVETNDKVGSVKEVKGQSLDFQMLWKSYPEEKDVFHNVPNIDDYCAIKVSEAFFVSGIKMKSFKGTRCWGECKRNRKHAIRARELAAWIKRKPFAGCPDAEKLTGKNFRDSINGKTGIVYFEDYWIDGETGSRTGDHIDLWDGRGPDKLASQSLAANILTNTFGASWDGWYSNKELSKEVLFWEIK